MNARVVIAEPGRLGLDKALKSLKKQLQAHPGLLKERVPETRRQRRRRRAARTNYQRQRLERLAFPARDHRGNPL